MDCAGDQLAHSKTKDPQICELLPEARQRAAHKMILVARARYTLFRMYPAPVSPSFARGFFALHGLLASEAPNGELSGWSTKTIRTRCRG